MDTFLMICYVCAEFIGRRGENFRVKPENLGSFILAPTWVKNTVMYRLLLQDGSIKIGLDKAEQKQLENDPMNGISADGKPEAQKEDEENVSEVTEEESSKPRRTTRAKKGEGK